MIRTALLLTFVLLATGCAGTIELEKAASSNKRDSTISIDIGRKLEKMISLDNGEMSRDSVGAVFQHGLDLQVDGPTGFKSVSYFATTSADVDYRVYFGVSHFPGEFEAGFNWWADNLPHEALEPPPKICISINKLIKRAESNGWKNLKVGKDYTTRPTYYMSKQTEKIGEPTERLRLISGWNSDCLVSLIRSRESIRPPL